MSRLLGLTLGALIALAPVAGARAGILFTPHVSEYARLAPGPYDEASLIYSRIEDVYDRDGRKTTLGAPFVPPGEHVDLAQLTLKWLWVGQPFRDSGLWFLSEREQFCRLIGTLGWQQASGAAVERSRRFGQNSGGSGMGDLFGLCGVYGREHRWGPLKFNGLGSVTVKAPIGSYETDSLLNVGTNYWSWIPQLALHAELFGRIYLDGTLAYQINGHNDDPAYGGLAPSDPADVRNAELNLAWKFSERWFADIGFSFRETVGANRYADVDITNTEPLPAEQACQTLSLDPAACAATSLFFLRPQPGEYRDAGIEGHIVTAGIYHVYRSSSVLSLRALIPVDGRGGQIDVPFDLLIASPDLQRPGEFVPGPKVLETTSTLNAVQEAASVSASPLIELRLVYLFWAP